MISMDLVTTKSKKSLELYLEAIFRKSIAEQYYEPMFSKLISHCFTCSQIEHVTDPLCGC